MINFIRIENNSSVPKYKQIIDSMLEAIDRNDIKVNQKMPSLTQICKHFDLSRDTVLTAYNELKAKGILISMPGKGYYLNKLTTGQVHNVFVLFDKFTAYKEILYDSIKEHFGKNVVVDIFFHHYNPAIFQTLVEQSIGKYTEYIVMPIPSKTVQDVLNLIPKDKLFILDMGLRLYSQTYASVCQNFKEDIYNGLCSGSDLLIKYKKLTLIFPETGHAPNALKRGFVQFCKDKGFDFDVVDKPYEDKIRQEEAFIVIEDKHLVRLVQYAKKINLTLGKDLGIISYNDTPLKSVVSDGITTMSTDFVLMGKTIAEMIINKKKDHIENPSSLIRRRSL